MAYDFVDSFLSENKATPKPASPATSKVTPKAATTTFRPPARPEQNFASPFTKTSALKQANVHGKLFEGGTISKGLDVLRLPEYALNSYAKGARDSADKNAPMVKAGKKQLFPAVAEDFRAGVKNILPGVQNRTQIGREEGDYNAARDLVKGEKAQTAINFGMSLGMPSTPVGKVLNTGSKIVSKVPGASKVSQVVQKTGSIAQDYLKDNPTVARSIERIPFLENVRNPEAGKILENSSREVETRISSLYNQISSMSKGLSSAQRVKVGNIIEGGITTKSNNFLVIRANRVKEISDGIAKELVESGLMSKESFSKFQGKYMAHIADVVRTEEKQKFASGGLKFTSDSLKKRKNLLGKNGLPDYVREFQFPTFKALSGEVQNIESVKAVKELVEKFGTKLGTTTRKAMKTGDVIKNFRGPRTTKDGQILLKDELPENIKSQFKDISVPQEIVDYVTRKYAKNDPGIFLKIADKALNVWKMGKTIYSGPGYHTRNLMSNQILSDYATGAGLAKTIAGYARAVKAYTGKGDTKMIAYMQELKDAGILGRVSISEGVENLRPEVFGQGENVLKKIFNSPKKFQQASEETAKMNVYAFFRDKGLTIKAAAAKAEEAIFSPYKINPAERQLLRGAIPFYSFTRQAVPSVIRTGINRGGTLTKYEKAKTAVEGMSPEGAKNNQNLPTGMRGQVRLPIKDKNGNYSYADPSYIIPHGNFDSKAGGQLPFGMGLNPLITEAGSQMYNKDLYFDQPIAKSAIPERANVQRIQHGVQTFAPNLLPSDAFGGIPSGQPGINYKTRGGSKLYDAFTGQKDYAGRTRSKVQALLDTFGLKSVVYDPATQAKFDNIDKAKAVKLITSEIRGIMKDNRLSPDEKKEIIDQLTEARKRIFSPIH